jgi:hypothetical protein
MMPIEYQSYCDIFSDKMKKCKSKKDYKRLCKEMIVQFDAIDHVDENKWQIFSSMIGEDNYLKGQAMAVKMYILEKQGIPFALVPEHITLDDNDNY